MATPPVSLANVPNTNNSVLGSNMPSSSSSSSFSGTCSKWRTSKRASYFLICSQGTGGGTSAPGFFQVRYQRIALFQNLRPFDIANIERGEVVGRDQRKRIDLVFFVGVQIRKLEPLVQGR